MNVSVRNEEGGRREGMDKRPGGVGSEPWCVVAIDVDEKAGRSANEVRPRSSSSSCSGL